MYQLTTTDSILRLADAAFIPPDPLNADYQRYLAWVNDGNTPEPAPAPPEPVPVPNWAALGDALVAELPILNKLAANPLFAALVGRLQTLRQGGAVGDPEPLIGLWNNHSYSFTSAERKQFNDLATDLHIPLRVATDGSLSAQ